MLSVIYAGCRKQTLLWVSIIMSIIIMILLLW